MSDYLYYLLNPAIVVISIAIFIIVYSDFTRLKKKKRSGKIKDFLPTIGVVLTLIATIISTIDSEKTEKTIICNTIGGDSIAFLGASLDEKDVISFYIEKKGYCPLYDIKLTITNRNIQAKYLENIVKNAKEIVMKDGEENYEKKFNNVFSLGHNVATRGLSVDNLNITENMYLLQYQVNLPKTTNEINFDIFIGARNGVINQTLTVKRCLDNHKFQKQFATGTVVKKQENVLFSKEANCKSGL